MRRSCATGVLVGVWLAAAAPLHAQIVLDRTLSRVNGAVITLSDVRQARALKLVLPAATADDAILTELENRRLILAEVARYPPPEPTPETIAARRRQWETSLAGDVPVSNRLAAAGMTEAGLVAWLRDDARIQAYIDRQFAATALPPRQDLLDYYRDHLADYTAGSAPRAFDQVEADVRAKVAARNKDAAVGRWKSDLRKRADIVRIVRNMLLSRVHGVLSERARPGGSQATKFEISLSAG